MGLSEVSSVQLQLLLSCEFLRTVFSNSSWIRKAWLNVVMFLQKSKEINLNLFLLCHIFHSILMHMSLPIWLRRLLLCRSPQFVLLLSAQGCFIQQGKERQKDTMSAFCPSNIQKVTLYPSDTSLSLSFVCPFLSRLYSKVHWIGKIRGFCVSSKKTNKGFIWNLTHITWTHCFCFPMEMEYQLFISRNYLLLIICHRKWRF